MRRRITMHSPQYTRRAAAPLRLCDMYRLKSYVVMVMGKGIRRGALLCARQLFITDV